jgi:hypothetical protein
VKKYPFWILLVIFTYVVIELLSYGGLLILNKYHNKNYEPVDVMTARQSDIINKYIKQKIKFSALSPTLGWTIAENGSAKFYQANSAGIRSSREYALTPPPGVLRVSTFGNSYTFGAEVKNDHTWEARMERAVPNLEVLNFGVSAYGLDQAYLRYLEDGQQYQSHIVLIGFMSENIFRNINTYRPFYFPATGAPLSKPRFVIKEDTLSLIPNPIKSPQDYKRLLLHPQDVLSEIGIHDFYYQKRYKSSKFDWSPTVRLAKIQIQEVLNHSPDEEIVNTGQYRYNEKSEAFKVTKKIFDAFYQASLKNKSTPIILIFPHKKDFLIFGAKKLKQYAPLLEYFDSEGYKYIDLMDAFKNPRYERLTLQDLFVHEHYSPIANSLVANYILRYLNNMSDQEKASPFRFPPRPKAGGQLDH